MEDGRVGDLSVNDIILFQIVANMRLGRFSTSYGQTSNKQSWWRRTVENVASGDSDAQEELERLLTYLEHPIDDECDDDYARRKSQTAIIFSLNLERACVFLFAPLRSTADQSQQLRRLHERFLDVVVEDIRLGLTLKGDYQSAVYQCSLQDFNATEIRADRSRHVIASRASTSDSSETLNTESETDRAENKSQSRNPLVVLCLSTNSPRNDECDIELVIFLDVIDIVFVPDCQWITRVKQLLNNISSLPHLARYWGDITMAYINSAASGRLSFLAKTETAESEHKNMDVDITIQCPILHIGDANGYFFDIDLGIAHIKTEKLAGVASTKLSDQSLRDVEIERHNTSGYLLDSIEEASSTLETSSSPSRFSQRYSGLTTRKPTSERYGMLSTSWSVDSRSRHKRAAPSAPGSVTFEDMTFKGFDPPNLSTGIRNTRAADMMFYDVYQFHLTTGKITIHSGSSKSKEVSSGFEVTTTIQTSVIPADHTLPRFKSHSAVKNFSLSLSLSVMLRLLHTLETWKAVLSKEPPAPVLNAPSAIQRIILPTRTPLPTSVVSDEVREGSASEIDEAEFFDAHEGNDSMVADGNDMWFDDNWIADAESVISKPTPDRRGRPRPSSISDVSSASDQSMRRRKGQGYLSAENLAKLEETAEDESVISESLADIDNDTFHSALSAGGQADLARELEEDIQKAEANVLRLKSELEESRRSYDGPHNTKTSKARRNARRSLKLDLERSVAEIHALRALQLDLRSSNGGNEGLKDYESRRSASVSASARSLLGAKKKMGEFLIDDTHNLTANLNRQLFQASIIFGEVMVTVQLDNDEDLDSSVGSVPLMFDICGSQTGIAVFHSANDTKAYFVVDHISASLRGRSGSQSITQFPLFGGTNDQLMEMQLPHHLPQYIASSMEEKFLRLSLEMSNRGREGCRSEIVKLRVVFGDVEITPHKFSLCSLLSFYEAVTKSTIPKDTPVAPKASNSSSNFLHKFAPNIGASSDVGSNQCQKYYDLAIRLASVRLAMSYEDRIVGAFAIAETSLRYVHCPTSVAFKCRSQLDLKCANFQVLSISSLQEGKGTECFGRSDPYGHLIVFRLRRQLVPASEQGGWVVDAEKNIDTDDFLSGPVAWNVHVGVKINPFTSIIASTDLVRLFDGIYEFNSIVARPYSVPVAAEEYARAGPSVGPCRQLSTRWRVDVVLRRSSVILATHKPPPDDLSLDLILSWSLLASAEEGESTERLVRVGVVDMSLSRHSDEWPLLEQFSVLCHFQSAGHKSQGSSPLARGALKLPADSVWNEISALMHRNEWDALPRNPIDNNRISLNAKVTPVRINVCGPVCVTLAKSVRPLYVLLRNNNNAAGSDDLAESSAIQAHSRVGIHVSLTAFEARLLREADNRPISLAEPLVSFRLVGAIIEYSQEKNIVASVVIEKSALYDLSVRPGVVVVGEDPSSQRCEKTPFVRAELRLEKATNGSKTMRITVHWGRIQCLVLPSLVRHALAFREVLSRQVNPKDQIHKREIHNEPSEIFSFREDINILVSAHAEAFELLVASRNVSAYVREQSPEPMGAVAFRWSASLNAAFAGAPTIAGMKSPWSTLNPDSSFTDASDDSLFKEFCHRYLDQSSGLLAASDEVGLRLGSAFTAVVNVKVSGFQAIRTNIESRRKRDSRRLYFVVAPPVAGERRITNSIDCEIRHRVSGATMFRSGIASPLIECSHLLEVESNFLDVLAYISQTNTGVTEAFKVNVKPIVDMVKRKEEHQARRSEGSNQDHASSANIIHALLRGSLVCSIRIQGFGITCVPGGATRLTEVRRFRN